MTERRNDVCGGATQWSTEGYEEVGGGRGVKLSIFVVSVYVPSSDMLCRQASAILARCALNNFAFNELSLQMPVGSIRPLARLVDFQAVSNCQDAGGAVKAPVQFNSMNTPVSPLPTKPWCITSRAAIVG